MDVKYSCAADIGNYYNINMRFRETEPFQKALFKKKSKSSFLLIASIERTILLRPWTTVTILKCYTSALKGQPLFFTRFGF